MQISNTISNTHIFPNQAKHIKQFNLQQNIRAKQYIKIASPDINMIVKCNWTYNLQLKYNYEALTLTPSTLTR